MVLLALEICLRKKAVWLTVGNQFQTDHTSARLLYRWATATPPRNYQLIHLAMGRISPGLCTNGESQCI